MSQATQITVPIVIDHEYLDQAVKEAVEEIKKQFIPKYVIEDAISQILVSEIPYADEYERAAFADGQGTAVMMLREYMQKEAENDKA